MIVDALAFAGGLLLVLLGANRLVHGGSGLGRRFGIPPAVIGVTVLGLGTSAPEIAIGALASGAGNPEVALGSALGSNVANIGLVLGAAALVRPLTCDATLVRREAPLMAAVSIAFLALAWTGEYERWHGAVMLALLALFLTASFFWARELSEDVTEVTAPTSPEAMLSAKRQWVWVAVGLALLVGGASVLVESAEGIADAAGVPEIVIAATIVAIGTSVPELATTLTAALRRESDLAIGNIVGSNVINLLGAVGLAALVRPIPIAGSVRDLEMVWMAAFGLIALLVVYSARYVSRKEGSFLLAAYVGFVVTLLL